MRVEGEVIKISEMRDENGYLGARVVVDIFPARRGMRTQAEEDRDFEEMHKIHLGEILISQNEEKKSDGAQA